MTEYKQFFEDLANMGRPIYPIVDPGYNHFPMVTKSTFWEDLYQAFKQRMKDEEKSGIAK